MVKIHTANDIIKHSTPEEYTAWVKARPSIKGYDSTIVKTHTEVDSTAAPAIAYVCEGEWIADCPSGCGAAMWLNDKLPFMCGFCFNVELGGKWRPVLWPKERKGIEAVLGVRLMHNRRNWRPGETVAELADENRAHGLESN